MKHLAIVFLFLLSAVSSAFGTIVFGDELMIVSASMYVLSCLSYADWHTERSRRQRPLIMPLTPRQIASYKAGKWIAKKKIKKVLS
jgi:hypothetical protein